MPVDLINMRQRLRKACGLEPDATDELPDDDADIYLNEAFWEIQNKFPFREKEKTVRFSTIAGTRSYDMPKPFDALISLSVQDPTTNEFHKLKRMSTDEYENRYDSDDAAQGFPEFYVREGCFARILPTPNDAYVVSLKRLITLDDLSDTNLVPDVPSVWWEIIRLGGIWRALIDFGDLNRANTIKIHQKSLQNEIVPTESKEERDSREAGVEVHVPEYRL